MTSTTAAARATGRGGELPAGAVALSPAVEAAQAALLARRSALGIVPGQRADLAGAAVAGQLAASRARPSPALADQGQAALEARRSALGIDYRRPGAVEASTWSAWAVERAAALDQGAGQGQGADLDGAAVAGHVGVQTSYGAGKTLVAGLDGAALDQGAPGGAIVGHIEMGHAAASTGWPSALPEHDRAHGAAAVAHVEGVALAGVKATVYPSLAAAMLQDDQAAAGRLWLLMRAWDTAGRGCYTLDQVYQAFAGVGSAWHVAGRRQVQKLVKAGAGVFWTLRDYRGSRYHGLQMTGPAGVGLALGLVGGVGRPVAVPVADLLQGMHLARATLYAAAVTTRRGGRGRRGGGARPVTRRTLAGMTGAAASTQRTYDHAARVARQTNYVLLPAGDVDAPGVFILRDYMGQHGPAGRSKLARRMANTYDAPLAAVSLGRMRKVNKRLNLVTNGARGYRPEVDYQRIYHDTAGQALTGYGRDYHRDHFWPTGQTAAGAGLWYVVEAV